MKLKDYKIAHYQLWDWLSKHPTKDKVDWPGGKDIEGSIENRCFACQYSLVDKDLGCSNCQVDKKAQTKFINENWFNSDDCLSGVFTLWKEALVKGNLKARKKYAELIRDLWGGMPGKK